MHNCALYDLHSRCLRGFGVSFLMSLKRARGNSGTRKEGKRNLVLSCLIRTPAPLDPVIPAGCIFGKCNLDFLFVSLVSPLISPWLFPHPPPRLLHAPPTRGPHLRSIQPSPSSSSCPLFPQPRAPPPPPLTPSIGARLWPLLAALSPPLCLTAVVSEGQMTGELAPGRAPSHPGAIRLVANNRCFRPGEDQSGGIMGNVQSAAFYTSAQMDEITLVSF